ncbi:MAG: nucleotidyltransferase domain-containing protein [Euryarchaeota archaeon]|nr:nucleotidyltransferase domain-containing protein [Euryarchaeota archaeon]
MLRKLFTSRTRVKLLTLFLMNPDREIYVREIARDIGENINSVRRELANLEEIGLLTSKRKGNLRYYVTDRKMPIFDELTSIILKTEGIAKILKDNLSLMGDIKIAFIYGSFARGDAMAESDIDVFIIGNVNEDMLIVAVREIEKKLSREVNYVLFTPEEFEERLENKDPFVSNVIREPKIMFIGDLHGPG